jgi:hypothetical protein
MAPDWPNLSLEQLLRALAGQLSQRKLRLLACAAMRRLPTAGNGTGEQAITLAERFADGRASAHELAAARYRGRFQPGHPAWAVCWDPQQDALCMVQRALAWAAGQAALSAATSPNTTSDREEKVGSYSWEDDNTSLQRWRSMHASHREEEVQVSLLREIAAQVFRPVVIDPIIRAWNDGTVVKLAQGVYEERSFAQMPILGDALEEAGCTDQALLTHCRQRQGHILGCWAVDLILGKE